MTSSVAIAMAFIVIYFSISSFKKKISLLRLGLTMVFLVSVVLYIGGQISALTFTAVSIECTSRNALLTFGDQLARVSALIVGLNVVARSRYQWVKYGLYVWALVRLSKSYFG